MIINDTPVAESQGAKDLTGSAKLPKAAAGDCTAAAFAEEVRVGYGLLSDKKTARSGDTSAT
ncbi:hypothetical protein [Variovorax saccharolyticus]|uniref:hypothetical protein n=1 Tax=Variovorax saccharolyticus TaxID=3053516 RepID=UPI0025752AA2|nr:hypothetical protein [Variovorax sp. J31P216]